MPVTTLSIHLYPEAAPSVDWPALADYLRGLLPQLTVDIRGPFFEERLSPLSPSEKAHALSRLAYALAKAKVRNPGQPLADFEPLPGEVDYERRRLLGQARGFGLLYDALALARICRDLIPEGERGLDRLHIIFTGQLFGTYEEADRRYHARVSLYWSPCLLSTTGLVEAPAKPREYYLLKQQYAALGLGDAPVLALDREFQGRFLEPEDPRLTEALKGYVLQALFYHLTGEAFCPDISCRLYNAHWQEEVIKSQLASGRLCPAHQARLLALPVLEGPEG